MQKKKFYITTTLPYVNAAPHIGFAREIIEADVIARYQEQILGKEVVFNTGTDEHGQKIWQKALEQNQSPKDYCDQWASEFKNLKNLLNLNFNHFIRTTDEKHIQAAQAFWRLCEQNGDIYKAKYKVKYCVGCELAKTESELVNGCCPLHPNQALELREEENYFFRFSNYTTALLNLYENNPNFVQPAKRLNEIKTFISNGLEDFSISRLKEKMPWGIEVPSDSQHVMYVWFDALVSYISTLDWPQNQAQFADFWPGIQLAGKDNLRQQAAMWQAMLLSAHLPNSTAVLINGFIGVNGQKMSKSLNNVISPQDMVARYGLDGTRYLLINLGTFGEDNNVSFEKFNVSYNANLANGLGNLCSRVAQMASQIGLNLADEQQKIALPTDYQKLMDNFALDETLSYLDAQVSKLNQFLTTNSPWQKEIVERTQILLTASKQIQQIALMISPFMPETAQKIQEHFTGYIKPFTAGLFPRLLEK